MGLKFGVVGNGPAVHGHNRVALDQPGCNRRGWLGRGGAAALGHRFDAGNHLGNAGGLRGCADGCKDSGENAQPQNQVHEGPAEHDDDALPTRQAVKGSHTGVALNHVFRMCFSSLAD